MHKKEEYMDKAPTDSDSKSPSQAQESNSVASETTNPEATDSSAASSQPVICSKPKTSPVQFLAFVGCSLILGVLILVSGIFTGKVIFADKTSSDNIDKDSDDSGYYEGDWSDDVADDQRPYVAPIADDDNLTLAFLKLHNQPDNSCYSPLSIRYALEMLRTGANGETKDQIDALLGDHEVPRYDNIDGHLALANSLWIQAGLEDRFSSAYIQTLKDKYGASLQSDAFKDAANMNKWIEDNTLGLLKDTLTDGEVQTMQAALVNVLALDMDWQHQFDELNTEGHYFNFDYDLAEDNPIYTTMQDYSTPKADSDTHYYYSLASQATLFANDLKEYNGTQLQFVALMPDNLPEFIDNLTVEKVNQLLSTLERARPRNDTYKFSFKVLIPKFKISGGIEDMIGDLEQLGVNDVFDFEKADLSGMTDIDHFFINAATHKTTFDFNEKGIKAAAVTVAGGRGAAGGPAPIPNSVDVVVSIHKPFMYLVRDKANGEIWFTGTVYKPNLWEDDKAAYSI